jgi:predicted membrane channel-forming protein YqfA (hemolysin III family)
VIVVAVASTGIATVATFVCSNAMLAPTIWTVLFMTLGFTGLAMARDLSARGDPRGRARLAMAGVAFAAGAAVFPFYPAFG